MKKKKKPPHPLDTMRAKNLLREYKLRKAQHEVARVLDDGANDKLRDLELYLLGVVARLYEHGDAIMPGVLHAKLTVLRVDLEDKVILFEEPPR